MESVQANDSQKIATILANADVLNPDGPTDNKEYILKFGRKELMVIFSVSPGIIITRVANVRESSAREQQETTLLYVAARQLMQEFVDKLGTSLPYVLSTKNQTMMSWAETTGATIFHWSKIKLDRGNPYAIATFMEVINPKKHSA